MSLTLRTRRGDGGFTMIELIVAITIMAMVMVALTGVVIAYFKHTRTTAARLNESAAVEFVAAYWQRDVSSVGIRSSTYNTTTQTFPQQNSVSVSASPSFTLADGTTTVSLGGSCGSAVSGAGSNLITLAWNEYAVLTPTTPNLVTVTYARGGTKLTRVRCHYSSSSSTWTLDSTNVLSSRITGTPSVLCDGGACSGLGAAPNIITLKISVLDTVNGQAGPQTYSVTLTGERRQSP